MMHCALQVLFALHDKTLLSGMALDGMTTCSFEPIHAGSSDGEHLSGAM